MDVTIYIDVYFSGNLKNGIGEYCIVLELINQKEEPVTKEHIGGISNTTKNRATLWACIAALGYMKKTCNIKIQINSTYVVNSINQDWDKTKNADLWCKLLERMAMHNVTLQFEYANSYSTYMYMQKRKMKIEYQNDSATK